MLLLYAVCQCRIYVEFTIQKHSITIHVVLMYTYCVCLILQLHDIVESDIYAYTSAWLLLLHVALLA